VKRTKAQPCVLPMEASLGSISPVPQPELPLQFLAPDFDEPDTGDVISAIAGYLPVGNLN
jgi:hypothetical protein